MYGYTQDEKGMTTEAVNKGSEGTKWKGGSSKG